MADIQRDPQAYPADKARQGEIILKTRTQRIIFIAGLTGSVLLAVLATVMYW